MRTHKYYRALFLLASPFVLGACLFAQGRPAEGRTPDGQAAGIEQQRDTRGNLLRRLGLSNEQIRAIRRINVERRPLIEEAQKRFRQANRALDEAVYADAVSEVDVHDRIKEVQFAQAEIVRIRSVSELSIRKVLTPEQLVRFREIRQQFETSRGDLQNQHRRKGFRRGDKRGPQRGAVPIDTVTAPVPSYP